MIIVSTIHKRLSEGNVLEIGCGGGYCLEHIRKSDNQHFLIGLDVSMTAIKERKVKGEKFNEIEFVAADATQLPFKEGIFDCVYSSEALEHIPSPEKFFDEAFIAMKQGALLVALTPNGVNGINPLYFAVAPLILFNKIKRKNIVELEPLYEQSLKPYDKALSPARLVHMLDQSGFHCVNVKFLFHFPPHSSFPKELAFSKRIYDLFRHVEPIVRIFLMRYGQMLVLDAEKT